VWYTPAERNRFTGEPITRIIRVQKTTTGEETAAIGVVIHPTKIVVMMTESNVIIVVIAETEARIGEAGTTIEDRRGMMTSAKRPLDRPEMRRMTTERRATRIIIIRTIRGIAIATGIGAETATIGTGTGTGIGIGDTLEMIGQRIGIGMNVRVITRKKIARDRGRDRGIAHRYRRLGQ